MQTAQDNFDQVKLTLHRLNEDWSPVGETFSHQAAMHLRRDWTEGSRVSAMIDIMKGQALLYKRYHDLMKLENYNPMTYHQRERWNQIYTAACSMLSELEDTLARDVRAKYEAAKRNYYNDLFMQNI